jgi:molybdopterin molybdotransferase
MINYQEAQTLLTESARSFGKERVGLEDACGRVLSEIVLADRDYPPFHRATMDGYAIRHHDYEQGTRHFRIAEVIYAGSSATALILSGECYKIMTGASVPAGADAIIRREDAVETGQTQGGMIDIGSATCRPFQYIARKGEDMRVGDEAIAPGTVCGPAAMGLLATLGKDEVLVERRPRVALFTTGDEVVPVDAAVNPVQIRNSNRWILQALLRPWGIRPEPCGHVPDDRMQLRETLEKAMQGSGGDQASADLVILSGGVSAGDADHVPGVLEELGVKRLFHGLSIKPGKPIWCGILPDGRMVFALPGNPFSCLVTFSLFVEHYLRACFGLEAPLPIKFPLQGGKIKRTPFDEFFPVCLSGDPSRLIPVPINSSGDIRLGLLANALALHPASSPDLPDGQLTVCYGLRW